MSELPPLYLIGDQDVDTLARRVEEALTAVPRGAVAVQLRARLLDGGSLFEAARALREVTRARGALLFVNDRIDVALASGADGVHLPSRGLPVSVARSIAPSLRIGVSTHAVEEAVRAVEEGADFVTFGPVFATPSKAGMGQPVGLDALEEAVRRVAAPVYALGGIDMARAALCAERGARIACIRAVLAADSPSLAALAMFTAAGAPKFP